MLNRTSHLARRALHRPAGYVISRIGRRLALVARRPWDRIRPRLLTDAALLRMAGVDSIDRLWENVVSAPFFFNTRNCDEWTARFRVAFPDGERHIVQAAATVLRHEFDLLGSGPVALGDPLPWHVDFKSGRQWPISWCHSVDANELDKPSDVKVPWELSRCQHVPLLGQAWWLTGDERFAREFVAQIDDWIDRNPYTLGINWACPMDVSLRAVSWIWGLHFFADAEACRSTAFRSSLLRSLYLHGEFVAANPEVDEVNGNHYLVDGVGLVFLGALFRSLPAAARWFDIGKQMVCTEIDQQVHEDGTGIEQSIAYHRLVLESFTAAGLLLRACGEPMPASFWRRLERMHDFVCAYVKPDGQAPLIGDADDGRFEKLGQQAITDHRYLLSTGAALFNRADFKKASQRFWEESFWLLGPRGLDAYQRIDACPSARGSRAFADGGFYILRGESAYVIVDCGEVGLKGLGGHGHNDVLSFEVSLDGLNVVTDSGCYLYTSSREWRNRFRSTAYHNTLQVDDEEINRFVHPDELWRLRYDAVPTRVDWNDSGQWRYVRAGHRGYERLTPPVTHVRTVMAHATEPHVVIADRVDGTGVHGLTWRFHLDPGIEAQVRGESVTLTAGRGRSMWLTCVHRTTTTPLSISLQSGWVSPRFGVKHPRVVVVATTTTPVPIDCVWVITSIDPESPEAAAWRAAIEECA